MRDEKQLTLICKRLLNRERDEHALEVSMEEFQRIYDIMVFLRQDVVPVLSIVNLNTEIFAQFSDVSPQHFIVKSSSPITRTSFGFVSKVVWHGAESPPPSFFRFVWDEIRQYYKRFSSIFLVSALLLFVANNKDFYGQISSMLITTATVFLTIYLVFTVAQSQILHKDVKLFASGILQKYYADDRNITILAILTIAIVFMSSAMLEIFPLLASLVAWSYLTVTIRILNAIIMAVAISLIFHSFFTVAEYYLDRARDVLERDLVTQLLSADFDQYSGITPSSDKSTR